MASVTAAAIAAGLAAPARADTIITATYKGTISQLVDRDARLGTEIDTPIASDLSFTDVFKFDLQKGLRLTGLVGGLQDDNLLGGSEFFGGLPLISSELTINGVSLDFTGSFTSQQETQQGRLIGSDADTRDSGTWLLNQIVIETNAPASLTTNFSGVATGHDFFGGSALICANLTAGACLDERFDVFLVASSVDVSVSVPEPASWALFILGFGGIGAGLRARRVVGAA